MGTEVYLQTQKRTSRHWADGIDDYLTNSEKIAPHQTLPFRASPYSAIPDPNKLADTRENAMSS